MKTLIRKLDKIFSEFIRLRDSDDNGICRCISCGKPHHWKEMDNGHFISRRHMSLRYSEKNCNAQCRYCNRFDESNFIGYWHGLTDKYGEGTENTLYAVKHASYKLTKFELRVMIDHYTELVKELKKQKA